MLVFRRVLLVLRGHADVFGGSAGARRCRTRCVLVTFCVHCYCAGFPAVDTLHSRPALAVLDATLHFPAPRGTPLGNYTQSVAASGTFGIRGGQLGCHREHHCGNGTCTSATCERMDTDVNLIAHVPPRSNLCEIAAGLREWRYNERRCSFF
jgi:hypothetical protein